MGTKSYNIGLIKVKIGSNLKKSINQYFGKYHTKMPKNPNSNSEQSQTSFKCRGTGLCKSTTYKLKHFVNGKVKNKAKNFVYLHKTNTMLYVTSLTSILTTGNNEVSVILTSNTGYLLTLSICSKHKDFMIL